MYSQEEIIKKFISVHGKKYIYDNFIYKKLIDKSIITCPIHGDFLQSAHSHLKGQGCPKCGIESRSSKKTMNNEQFIEKANKIHHGKYDYSKTQYERSNKKVCIICPIHGEFMVRPNDHLMGRGCTICGNLKKGQAKKDTLKSFIEKAKEVHGNKFDYSKSEYINSKTKICIICPVHGEFWQSPDSHLQGVGCPKCGNSISNAENDIAEFCASILGEEKIIHRDRSVLKNRELDIYIPSKQMAIEYNGLIWHSDKFGKDKNYHLSKTEECKKLGIKLIQIFEDEYVNHKEIVLNKIAHIIGEQKKLPKIMARKCEIKEIKRDISKEFLDKYHIQGSGQGKVHLGAFYEGKIIAVMSFKEETNGSNKWELTRFASDYHYICQGVGGKLFKYFIRNYIPIEIKSFADRRWTVDEEHNIYIQLGFKFEYYTKPEYRYIDGIKCERHHKFGFRKDALMKKYGDKYDLNIGMTETEMTEKIGFHKIWDCGLIKYVWKQK